MPKPSILVLETSTPQGSIGSFSVNKHIWVDHEFTSARMHDVELFSPLQKLLKNISIGEISLIIVGTGPGSYGGVRVAIAAAIGLAIVHDCPIVGLPSILGTSIARAGKKCLALGDARRGDWWWSEINHGKMISHPQMGNRDIFETITSDQNSVLFSLENPERLNLEEKVHHETPTAKNLFDGWMQLNESEKNEFLQQPPQPVYLKPPHITMAKTEHPLAKKS
jgi:tRNA threonylcarbamoyladenosine biosynthesis protein TsaB